MQMHATRTQLTRDRTPREGARVQAAPGDRDHVD